MMEAGQPINRLLEEVALLVLCKANHGYQAPEIARRWRGDISSYTQRQTVRRGTELTFLELGETLERLAHRYHGRISHNQRNVPTTTVSAPDREQRGSRSGRSSTRNRHTASPSPVRMETRPPRISAETSRQSTRELTRRVEGNSRSLRGHTASEQGSSLPIRERSQRNSRGRTTRSRNVSRQPIEGECSICLDLLLDDESSENRIVWCAKSCGNNFHRDCLNEWIRRGDSPRNSCPICRDTENTWAD